MGQHRVQLVALASIGHQDADGIAGAGALAQRDALAMDSPTEVRCWGQSGRSGDMAGESVVSHKRTHAKWSRSFFAALKSAVSKPSVNQP